MFGCLNYTFDTAGKFSVIYTAGLKLKIWFCESFAKNNLLLHDSTKNPVLGAQKLVLSAVLHALLLFLSVPPKALWIDQPVNLFFTWYAKDDSSLEHPRLVAKGPRRYDRRCDGESAHGHGNQDFEDAQTI